MMRWLLLFLLTCCFSLATILQPYFAQLTPQNDKSTGVLVALMGDSRRLFANHFFAVADAYFHSGFYPTIFDQRAGEKSDLADESREKNKVAGQPEEEEPNFLGRPKDWIDAFGRNFYPVVHTHLHAGNEREILPWLKISAELDPTRIETYLTAAYWLRTDLKKPEEAAKFLREGLAANPDSYEILLALGRVYADMRQPQVARNLWLESLRKWEQQDATGKKPDAHVHEEILGELVRDDQRSGDLKKLLTDLEALKKVSQSKASLDQLIQEVKVKLGQ